MGSRALLFATLLLAAAAAAAAQPLTYSSGDFNRVCKNAARNVSRAVFEGGIDGGGFFLMPLETGRVVTSYSRPWQACFGPGEATDLDLVRNGSKLPCFYRTNAGGGIDFWELNACDVLVRANCYCFAIGRFVGSYCEPGLGGTGQSLPLPVSSCAASVAGVVADGGRRVDRETVYNTQPSPGSHFIALAVKPPADAQDTGDYHFWRLDADGTWSYKAGDTLSRRTFRNSSAIRDIEAPEARGAYIEWCGFFQVWPATHKLVGNGFYHSPLPSRLRLWRDAGLSTSVMQLPELPALWLSAYKSYFADSGWEDALPIGWAAAKERARAPPRPGGALSGLRTPPHTYSVRPPGLSMHVQQ